MGKQRKQGRGRYVVCQRAGCTGWCWTSRLPAECKECHTPYPPYPGGQAAREPPWRQQQPSAAAPPSVAVLGAQLADLLRAQNEGAADALGELLRRFQATPPATEPDQFALAKKRVRDAQNATAQLYNKVMQTAERRDAFHQKYLAEEAALRALGTEIAAAEAELAMAQATVARLATQAAELRAAPPPPPSVPRVVIEEVAEDDASMGAPAGPPDPPGAGQPPGSAADPAIQRKRDPPRDPAEDLERAKRQAQQVLEGLPLPPQPPSAAAAASSTVAQGVPVPSGG